MPHAPQGLLEAAKAAIALWPVSYLASGSMVSVVNQVMNNAAIAHPSAQLVPMVKYGVSFLMSFAVSLLFDSKAVSCLMSKQFWVKVVSISVMGFLDILAYMMYVLGSSTCGIAMSSVIQAASGQILTAVLRRTVLNRPLSLRQYLAVFVVSIGLALRSIPALMQPGYHNDPEGESVAVGIALIVSSAFTYSVLGVAYEGILTNVKGVTYAEINLGMSAVGAVAIAAYQALFTWPRRQELVLDFLSRSYLTPENVIALYTCLGAIFTLHVYVQGRVLELHGAQVLGIINAMRSSVVSLISGFMFCSPDRPSACITPASLLSALVVSAGVLMWTLSKPQLIVTEAVDKPKVVDGGSTEGEHGQKQKKEN